MVACIYVNVHTYIYHNVMCITCKERIHIYVYLRLHVYIPIRVYTHTHLDLLS